MRRKKTQRSQNKSFLALPSHQGSEYKQVSSAGHLPCSPQHPEATSFPQDCPPCCNQAVLQQCASGPQQVPLAPRSMQFCVRASAVTPSPPTALPSTPEGEFLANTRGWISSQLYCRGTPVTSLPCNEAQTSPLQQGLDRNPGRGQDRSLGTRFQGRGHGYSLYLQLLYSLAFSLLLTNQ